MTRQVSQRRIRAKDEHGFVIVLFALLLVVLMLMLGLVLDFGQVRDDRQSNKSSADFAVTAGLQHLDNGDGVPQPWKAVCAAIDYLEANNDRFEGIGDGGLYQDGDENDEGTPCTSQGAAYTKTCRKTDDPDVTRESWAWFHGETSDGSLQVDIKSGYILPDGDFDYTDGQLLGGGDLGDPEQNGCDQLAVIISQARDRGFSAVAGSGELDSRIRSVGRVQIGPDSGDAVALLLLERKDCRAARTVGGNAFILVEANTDLFDVNAPDPDDARPGFIHADSDGSGNCPGGARVLEGEDLNPSNGSPDPSIKAEHARHPSTGELLVEGRLSSPAVGSNPTKAYTSWPFTVGEPEPTDGDVAGRDSVDERYLTAIADLYTTVNSTFAGGSGGGSWHVVSGSACTSSGTVQPPLATPPAPQITKVWFDCPVNVPNGGEILVQGAAGDELTHVVVNGELAIGSGGAFRVPNVRHLYVDGTTTGNKRGVDNGGGTLEVNNGPAPGTACTSTPIGLDDERTTRFVLRKGSFFGSNGSTRLCQTTFYLMNNTNGYPNAPDSPVFNEAPYSCGSCNGFLSMSGTGVIDWSAPNSVRGRLPTASDLAIYPFEDLALWTEASASSSIGGGGGIKLTGIYFLPNADPYSLNGSGGQVIDASAQFLTRKLELNGNTTLSMHPNPHDVVPVQIFEGWALVR